MKKLLLKSPVDGKIFAERDYCSEGRINEILSQAVVAQKNWQKTSIGKRKELLTKFVKAFVSKKQEISTELSWQMGRPVLFSGGEVSGTEERAMKMIELSEDALGDIKTSQKDGFIRYIKREPLGTVFVIPAWNYPYLISINSVVPALLSGNAVVLKHSSQTPLCAERFMDAFKEAGLPEGLFAFAHLTHDMTAKVIQDNRVDFVAFTGSVEGGKQIVKAASSRFIGIGLELGGKDPAYVCDDIDIAYAAENLADGAFFNTGQSCCGIERIYVHKNSFEQFVDEFVGHTYRLKLGNPLDNTTTLGPMAKLSGVKTVKEHVAQAIELGAKALIDRRRFAGDFDSENYLAPNVLIDVDHKMDIMTEESFGPVVGIMKVDDDLQAVQLMNDSRYGLTASIWTGNSDRAVAVGDQVSTGTWFMNRCDYLDPELAWTGVKNTGRGCTLSKVGFEQLTRPKSYHLKLKEGK